MVFRAGSAIAGCSGSYPGWFWLSPGMLTSLLLWATSTSVWPPHSIKVFLIYKWKIPRLQFVPVASYTVTGDHCFILFIPPFRYLYTLIRLLWAFTSPDWTVPARFCLVSGAPIPYNPCGPSFSLLHYVSVTPIVGSWELNVSPQVQRKDNHPLPTGCILMHSTSFILSLQWSLRQEEAEIFLDARAVLARCYLVVYVSLSWYYENIWISEFYSIC